MLCVNRNWREEKDEVSAFLNPFFSEIKMISLKDEGFLPDYVISPYRYYVQNDVHYVQGESPLFADNLEVPELWEIVMNYDKGVVFDEGIKKAEIEYAEPTNFRNVRTVKWMLPNETVYKIDHYDKYGKLFYDEVLDGSGNVNVRTYYAEKYPVIVCQPKRNLYTLMGFNGNIQIFDSECAFLLFFMKNIFPSEKRIVSFDEELQKEITAAGMDCCLRKRFEVVFPENSCGNETYVLTHSDQVEQIEKLIAALPQLHFHIAAITRMSDKLLNLERYPNVSLYQGISEKERKELLQRCTYYLDINHYLEICDAVYEAYRHNLLLVGFDNTLHNAFYVLPQCIFPTTESDNMIDFLNRTYEDKHLLKKLIMEQEKLPLKECF